MMTGLFLLVQFGCMYACISMAIKNMARGRRVLGFLCAMCAGAGTYLFFYTLGSIGAFGGSPAL